MNHKNQLICRTFASVLLLALVLTGVAGAKDANALSTAENSIYQEGDQTTNLPFFDGSYYQAVWAYMISWNEANAAANVAVLDVCESAHLVTITSQEEQDALNFLLGYSIYGMWLGGFQNGEETDPAAGWNWVTGEPWAYTNWTEGQPDDDGGWSEEQYLLTMWDGTWSDEDDLGYWYAYGYIIEYDDCQSPRSTGLPFFDGSYYQLVNANMGDWNKANLFASKAVLDGCESAHLVTITSQAEQDALNQFFDEALEGKWFGGFQEEGELVPDVGWHWVTGEPWEYTNWGEGEPNDAYEPGMEQYLGGSWDGYWNDAAYNWGYVVEYEHCISPSKSNFVTGGGWFYASVISGSRYFDGSYYQVIEMPGIAWADANAAANTATLNECENAHLVTITSESEQNALYGFFSNVLYGKWYGGFQEEDVLIPDAGWHWVTGEPWEYTYWSYGEPNDASEPGAEQHLAGAYDGGWNDEGYLENITGYVIEYEQCEPPSKATFAFVSKHIKGAAKPVGNVEFQFQAADLNFHSSSYEYLWITDGNYAVIQGVGTINGKGEYLFKIQAGDGTGADGTDTFRIKIWSENKTGMQNVIYDNMMDQSISGGSIVVHMQ